MGPPFTIAFPCLPFAACFCYPSPTLLPSRFQGQDTLNAVEIEQAVSHLAEQPFDPENFPFDFLRAFGNKETTISRLQKGGTNLSDIPNAILQRNNIHIAVCPEGETTKTLQALKASPATSKSKAKFILATDGLQLEAENLLSNEPLVCTYQDFPNRFAFFLPLAGITMVRSIADNAFDIRATSRLNKLYVELLQDNPDWAKAKHRHDMNHFMARLIFCFFAEDTDIFNGDNLFTATVEQMSARDSSNTHEIISEIFRAMNTKIQERKNAKLRPWADAFPYVNGDLFSGSTTVPHFSKIARSYLIHIGNLNWQEINPDIFGSMIQAIADDEERGVLGLHYTSVPNILKLLNPLFLDDLHLKLFEAENNPRKLLNLRNRMAKIRVFDPACGSGNFLVIAYKEMRQIEADINRRRGETDRSTEIPIENFRGIELRDFPAEIARLALVIAQYQCDVIHRGQKDALKEFLPLSNENWITCGNALKLDWLSICPPTGKTVKFQADDLLNSPLDQAQIDFRNKGGETYICGNPPYLGSTWQSAEQKADLKAIFGERTQSWRSLDYVAGWFMKAADYGAHTQTISAFVTTNSICQGQSVPVLWPLISKTGHKIAFAHTSFKWANLARHNAGVTVAIVGITNQPPKHRKIYSMSNGETDTVTITDHINSYLVSGPDVIVNKTTKPIGPIAQMLRRNSPTDGGNLLLSTSELSKLKLTDEQQVRFIRRIYGSAEFIRGLQQYVLWIEDEHLDEALAIPAINQRIQKVREMRLASPKKATNEIAAKAHQMAEIHIGKSNAIIVPRVSSENREYLPVGIIDNQSIVKDRAFALYDAPLWNMALLATTLHYVWIATVCGKLETRLSYSNTLGWHTFPVPKLTRQNKQDLSACAENILLAREAHFPATIADLYDPKAMPDNLRHAHDQNDETLERIYIGRRFRNDTERLEKLFDMYTKMTKSATVQETDSQAQA